MVFPGRESLLLELGALGWEGGGARLGLCTGPEAGAAPIEILGCQQKHGTSTGLPNWVAQM